MRSIETSGKTVEDAIRSGLKELKCDYSDVKVDVLEMGSPGLFGMFGRLAKVRLTVKEEDSSLDIEMPVMSLDGGKSARKSEKKSLFGRNTEAKKPVQEPKKPEAVKKPAPVAEPVKKAESKPVEAVKPQEAPKAAPVAAEAIKPEAAVKPEAKPVEAKTEEAPEQRKPRAERTPRAPREGGERAPREKRPAPRPRPEVKPLENDLPPLEVDKLSEVGKAAYDFLKGTTELMGVNVDIRMAEEENQLKIQMFGDTLGILIGRRGETLDALQYLTSLTVNKGREDYMRVSLDTEHYRAKREDALRKLALRMAGRARKTNRRVALEPMNPYERRILHSALQNNPYVTTHSEGEEPYRRVIITLK